MNEFSKTLFRIDSIVVSQLFEEKKHSNKIL